MTRPGLFDRIVNCLCVAAIAYGSLALMGRFRGNAPADPTIAGATLSIPLPTARTSLVMMLSTTCRFCTESAPFYKTLLRANADQNVYVVGIFPQNFDAAATYLKELELPVQDIRQGDLTALGITGTPTLLLVAPGGRIERAWRGRLSPEQEDEVFRAVGVTRDQAPRGAHLALPRPHLKVVLKDLPVSMPADLARLMETEDVPIVDVRDRDQFVLGAVHGAINIPADELETRATHELPRDRTIHLYCNYMAECDGALAVGRTSPRCETGYRTLLELGFQDLRIINTDLRGLQAAKVPTRGTELLQRAAQ